MRLTVGFHQAGQQVDGSLKLIFCGVVITIFAERLTQVVVSRSTFCSQFFTANGRQFIFKDLQHSLTALACHVGFAGRQTYLGQGVEGVSQLFEVIGALADDG